LEQLIKKSIIL